MKTLAVISQKGGVGKTTLATCLAVAAERDGKRTAIFDLDPQATASFWHDVRPSPTPAVVSFHHVRLPAMLKAAEESGTDLVIIDGAAVERDISHAAAELADFVLLPTKAAVFDTMSMTQTMRIVREYEKPVSIVLNFVPPTGPETDDAGAVAQELQADLSPVLIGNRKAFFRAQAKGLSVQEFQPSSKAAQEIAMLYEYISIVLYSQNSPEEDHEQRKLATGSA